jgi:hypothetical protein
MPTPGFIGNGFYTSKLLFGGVSNGLSPVDFVQNSEVYMSNDLRFRDLTLNSFLYVHRPSPPYNCFKLFCEGTLTINSGGVVSANAQLLHGNLPNQTNIGGIGFDSGGSVGGSGSGGDAQTGAGSPGAPNVAVAPLQPVFLGGYGGGGGTRGADSGGVGGATQGLDTINNEFQSSVYEHAGLWVNPAIYGTTPATFEEWTGYYAPGYAMVPVCGGGGGGGCADRGLNATGGGGAGGGVIYIAANKIVMNGGEINAGGQGAIGFGGGGGGGTVILVTNELVFVPGAGSTISAPGGANGGAGSTDGYGGTVLLFSDQLVASFKTTMDLTETTYNRSLISYHR